MDVDDAAWASWQVDWLAVLDGVGHLDAPAFATGLFIDAPASKDALARLQHGGINLPVALADVIGQRSASVGFHWRLVDLEGDGGIEAPMFGSDTPLWGGCHTSDEPGALWDLAALPKLASTHQSWIVDCFQQSLDEEPNDPYAAPWVNKLPIIEVADGDMIVIDMADGPRKGQVVYLCHDDACVIHGQVLGTDFVDFMTRWSQIGCVGPEGWYLELFVEDGEFAAANSPTVHAWRSWLGMPASSTT